MTRLEKTGLLFTFAGLLTACGSGPYVATAPTPEADQADRSESIEIRVVNLNYSDARLWLVVRRGMRHPLGTVTGKDDGTFVVPWRFSAPVFLEIDLLGGGRCTSDQLVLDPGDWVDFRIPVAFREGSSCGWPGNHS